jgi:aminopeptidase-like protein
MWLFCIRECFQYTVVSRLGETLAGQSKERKHLEEALADTGEEMYQLIQRLYPICRSITGKRIVKPFRSFSAGFPLNSRSCQWYSGLRLDGSKRMEHPRCVHKNPQGEKIVDFAKSNLHVVRYSAAFTGKLALTRVKAALVRASRPSSVDSLPNKLLQRDLGILSQS